MTTRVEKIVNNNLGIITSRNIHILFHIENLSIDGQRYDLSLNFSFLRSDMGRKRNRICFSVRRFTLTLIVPKYSATLFMQGGGRSLLYPAIRVIEGQTKKKMIEV